MWQIYSQDNNAYSLFVLTSMPHKPTVNFLASFENVGGNAIQIQQCF